VNRQRHGIALVDPAAVVLHTLVIAPAVPAEFRRIERVGAEEVVLEPDPEVASATSMLEMV